MKNVTCIYKIEALIKIFLFSVILLCVLGAVNM